MDSELSRTSSGTVIAATGLTGFLGQHLQHKLVTQQLPVRAIVRAGYQSNLIDRNIDIKQVSLDDTDGLISAFNGVSHVLHLAGSVRGRHPCDFYFANIKAVETITRAIEAQESPPSLLLVSSIVAQQPDLSDYSASKFAGEQILIQHPDIHWSIIRPPAIYGPGDREMLPLLKGLRQGLTIIPGNDAQRLGFMHVDDVASAIMHWIDKPLLCDKKVFELDDGTPDGYDWEAIANAAGKGTDKNLKLVIPVRLLEKLSIINRWMAGIFSYAPMLTPGKVQELTHDRWVGNNEPFTTLTGWQPQFDLASGVKQTFENL